MANNRPSCSRLLCLTVLATCIGQHFFDKTQFWLLVDVIELGNSYINRCEKLMHTTRRNFSLHKYKKTSDETTWRLILRKTAPFYSPLVCSSSQRTVPPPGSVSRKQGEDPCLGPLLGPPWGRSKCQSSIPQCCRLHLN